MALYEFLEQHRDEIIRCTKAKVALRPAPRATDAELSHGVPAFFDQLIDTLKHSAGHDDEMDASATRHGSAMLRLGFTVAQVVQGYGDVCQAVTQLAFELKAPITVDEFSTLNRCLDEAIANAVTEYGRLREQSLTDNSAERLGVLAHEMRNQVNTAMLSFAILRDGAVSIGGSTGAVLERSLKGLVDLIDHALAEVRLESSAGRKETILLAEFIEEVEIAAIMEANSLGRQLSVAPVEYGVSIEGDRQLLAAAVANLLQNAFKFSRDGGKVSLHAYASANRVFIDVEDECGGLPAGRIDTLFERFHQAASNRTGLGLGLSISRQAVRLHGGDIGVRDLPGKGCVFSVDLPREDAPRSDVPMHPIIDANRPTPAQG